MKPTIATNNTRVKTAITPMTMGITSGLSVKILITFFQTCIIYRSHHTKQDKYN